MKKILLVGNGINGDSPGYKWGELISELIAEFGRGKQIIQGAKPFPLLYEEIVLRSSDKVLREKEIKEFIAERVKRIEPSRIHHDITEAAFDNILTTNYDYNLEATLGGTARKLKNLGRVKETRYSLFRHSNLGRKSIWHIHGEANSPSSILLGYEQYCGYLQYMRNYIVAGTGESYKDRFTSLLKRIKDRERSVTSWVDFFFFSDVYILGLTMDFVEMHLWWILTYRARAAHDRLIPIQNKIVFFAPTQYVDSDKDRFQLLKSCGVMLHTLPYDRKKRYKYYRQAIKIALNH